MSNLMFINYGRTPCLKVYDFGYILYTQGAFIFAEKYDDEFVTTNMSFLPQWNGTMKEAFVSYCQILPSSQAAFRLLADFRNKENLKFLQIVAGANTGETFVNPKTIRSSCTVLPTVSQLINSGIYVDISTSLTLVYERPIGTLAIAGESLSERLFAIYFALYCMGYVIVNDQILSKSATRAVEHGSNLHQLIFHYVKGRIQ